MPDDVAPIWNPDGNGLLGGSAQPAVPNEPARGMPGASSPDEPLAQPGVLNGAVPQDGGGGGGTAVAVRAVEIDSGTGLPTTVTITVLT